MVSQPARKPLFKWKKSRTNYLEVKVPIICFLITLQTLGLKLETLAQVFSREFCEISKNIFFKEHLCVTTFIPYCFEVLTAEE